MGGSPSVHDNLLWIAQVLALTGSAVKENVPVIGHCLGGQLLAKALGAEVSASPTAEIGWNHCDVENNRIARDWFGDATSFPAFQWHFESFAIPNGATRVLHGANCPNQAFVLGIHYGSQAHIEVDENIIRYWIEKDRVMLASLSEPGVQTSEQILSNLAVKLPAMRRVTERIYAKWVGYLLN